MILVRHDCPPVLWCKVTGTGTTPSPVFSTYVHSLCFKLILSFVATLGNFLVIRAIWKASSMPANLKKTFLSLAFSDLAVGLFSRLMQGVIMAVMLKNAANQNYNFDFLCPTVLTICYLPMFFLACASFLNITVIAVDRLIAVLFICDIVNLSLQDGSLSLWCLYGWQVVLLPPYSFH